MPAIETSGLIHKALLWEAVGLEANARQTVRAAVEIRCRWNDVQQEAQTATGETFTTSASVKVDREVPINSILWRGGFDDLPGTGLVPEGNLHEVKGYRYVDDVKGRNTNRRLFLSKYGSSLPRIVA